MGYSVENINDKIIYFDLDDTLNYFTKAYNEIKKQDPSIEYPQSIKHFFLNLEPNSDGLELVKELDIHNYVLIATRPSYMNPLCYTEKRLWVEKYLGLQFAKKLIIIEDKSLLKGHFLIDDKKQIGFQGIQILFENNWEKVVEKLNYHVNLIEDDDPW